ncbi:SOS response associated peptidase (SRAP) [Nitrosospira sp. Nsp2]|nr:SOS response associated peptidase (SRAP) [Nitrosospira sp. Nsp2]
MDGREWKKAAMVYNPLLGKPIFMAGLTDWKPQQPKQPVQTVETGFVIVTEDSGAGMVDIYDRRPVVLEPEDHGTLWTPKYPLRKQHILHGLSRYPRKSSCGGKWTEL